MCIAAPGKIKKIEGQKVFVEYPGEVRPALAGGEPVKVGDFVLVQMGIVIQILSSEEAKEAQKAWGALSSRKIEVSLRNLSGE